jgi:hypothetical protein
MIKISSNQYKRLEVLHETVDADTFSSNADYTLDELQMERFPERNMGRAPSAPETMDVTCHESITCVVVLCDNPDSLVLHRISGEDTCFVCMENPQDAVLLDCGHSGICVACASRLWERDRHCPLCREGIAGIMRMRRSHTPPPLSLQCSHARLLAHKHFSPVKDKFGAQPHAIARNPRAGMRRRTRAPQRVRCGGFRRRAGRRRRNGSRRLNRRQGAAPVRVEPERYRGEWFLAKTL